MIDKADLAALRARDYVRFLGLWLVPEADRAFALALFNLETELQAIPAKVTEPTLGLMRIVWWRDAVAEGAVRAHPLLQALQPYLAQPERARLVADWVESFDLPFLAEAEQNERLQQRQALECRLFGQTAALFIQRAQKKPHARPFALLIQAFRGLLRRKHL